MAPLKNDFVADERWSLLSQGAEARVWKIPSGTSNYDFTVDAVAKERFPKSYRHPILDERLTKQRCRAESRVLTKCLEKGKMDVPIVLRTEPPILYLEYIDGISLRAVLDDLVRSKTASELLKIANKMGAVIGRLHSLGVVHGDLTSSNMMIRSKSSESILEGKATVVLIDFGLAKNTESAEERAVDLYVLERALSSTHPNLPYSFFDELLKEYGASASKAGATLSRLEQVRQRGRKRECFG